MPEHIVGFPAFPYNGGNTVDVRLSVLETNMHTVQTTLEAIEIEERDHRRSHTAQTEEINSKMEALRKELRDDLSTVKNDLTKTIVDEIAKQNKMLDKISDKLDSIEKWRWIVVGFATAIGFVIAEFGKWSKLFN